MELLGGYDVIKPIMMWQKIGTYWNSGCRLQRKYGELDDDNFFGEHNLEHWDLWDFLRVKLVRWGGRRTDRLEQHLF